MFSRSRTKIILSIMGSLILLFALTLSVILLASYRELQKRSADILQDYIAMHSLEQPPDAPEDPGPGPGPQRKDQPGETRDFKLSTFYSVSFSEDGTVLAVDNGMRSLYSDEELIELAEEIREKRLSSGRRDQLLFRVVSKDGYELVAFMDNTVTDSSMHTLLRYVLIVGSTAIAVMFVISLFLSKRIIQPLEENDQKQKQFISDASHELKTPVAVISANAEMLVRELGNNEWLSNIQYENDRMGELVRQLLDLSRAENADIPAEPVDLSRIVTGEILAFESLAFEQGKIMQSEIEEEICVVGRSTQLAQLAAVLLDNAITYSTGNTIEVSLSRQAHKAVLKVRNEGEAISAEKQEHLFDRFYQVDEARTHEKQHYGLGLSIARAVTEKHGGSIGVSCYDGKVEFTVSLPIRK